VAQLEWKASAPPKAAAICGERLWFAHEAGGDGITLSSVDASGKLADVATLASTGAEAIPMLCHGESAVVAHRTVAAKAGNVTFWLSTVDAKGKVRERRVKDLAGNAETIRFPSIVGGGSSHRAFWVEGAGPQAKVWWRKVVCD
jgi:hypothetical protein